MEVTEPNNDRQRLQNVLRAFKEVCDGTTARLRVDITDPEAQSALWRLNVATAGMLRHASQRLQFCVGAILAQGACLLVAVLADMDLMQSAWSGPPCALKEKTVRLIKSVKGGSTLKVGCYLSAIMCKRYHAWERPGGPGQGGCHSK